MARHWFAYNAAFTETNDIESAYTVITDLGTRIQPGDTILRTMAYYQATSLEIVDPATTENLMLPWGISIFTEPTNEFFAPGGSVMNGGDNIISELIPWQPEVRFDGGTRIKQYHAQSDGFPLVSQGQRMVPFSGGTPQVWVLLENLIPDMVLPSDLFDTPHIKAFVTVRLLIDLKQE